MTNEEMFNSNIKIAYKIANQYLTNYLTEYEDIKQIALLGLWKSVLTYDSTKYAFTTYSYRVISNEINLYLRRNKKHNSNISVNKEIGENITIADTITDEKNYIEQLENHEETKALQQILDREIKQFKKREQDICLLMLQHKKQVEIAEKLNISQPHVARIERKIKNKLSKFRGNL